MFPPKKHPSSIQIYCIQGLSHASHDMKTLRRRVSRFREANTVTRRSAPRDPPARPTHVTIPRDHPTRLDHPPTRPPRATRPRAPKRDPPSRPTHATHPYAHTFASSGGERFRAQNIQLPPPFSMRAMWLGRSLPTVDLKDTTHSLLEQRARSPNLAAGPAQTAPTSGAKARGPNRQAEQPQQ